MNCGDIFNKIEDYCMTSILALLSPSPNFEVLNVPKFGKFQSPLTLSTIDAYIQ